MAVGYSRNRRAVISFLGPLRRCRLVRAGQHCANQTAAGQDLAASLEWSSGQKC